MMKVEGMDRVSFAVKDYDKAAEFFSGLLGVKFDGHTSKERSFKVGYAKCGATGGIELLQPTNADSMVGRFIAKRGEGVYNMVFRVTDIDAWDKHFKSKGMHLRGEIVRNGLREVIYNPQQSYNIPIVLAEYPDMHPATCAAWHFEGPGHYEQKLYP
jgi:catechol 2,3-dioxygenase-like lactoylglutathione lyase family enzyme